MSPAHASRLAATWTDRGDQPWRSLDGSAVLADLSDFTRLTEVLTGTGAEGVEVLHRAINTSFAALLGRSLELDGDVIGFAGDAALVWFDGDHHAERAVRAAAAMPTGLAAIPASLTGRSRLRASVGVHSGRFLAVRTGSDDQAHQQDQQRQHGQHGVFLCGPETTLLARLEAAAAPMQVLISRSTAQALPPAWLGKAIDPGVELDRRRVSATRPLTTRTPLPAHPDAPDREAPDREAPDREAPDRDVPDGEHRDVSIGFLLVPGVDRLLADGGPSAVYTHLQHVTDVVVRVAADQGLTWLDCDVGVDSVKFLLTAGVPRALDDDDARMLWALRHIVDECDVPLRAGAQRGRVFSGMLGVATRRTLTVLGDPVNVAARALGRAADGDVVVGDGLHLDRHRWVATDPIGPQQLKNRARPMDMWRVTAVGDRPLARPKLRSTASAALSRRDEWDLLADAWKRTIEHAGQNADARNAASGTAHRGRSVTLIGEPGMGASELVAELVDLAGGAAISVVADRFRRHVPYSGLSELVRSLARSVGSDAGDGGWAWLAAFTPRLPTALQSWSADALAVASGGDTTGHDPLTVARRTRQVLSALIAHAIPSAWLLAVEDVDQLDDASQHVIDDLRRSTPTSMLLVTTRDEPPNQADTDALADPVVDPEASADLTIVLEPLDAAAAEQFLVELAPHLRRDQIHRIVDAGGGNPFVIAELLDHADHSSLPDSLHRMAASLVDSLPTDARATVLDASVFGMELDPALMAAVLGRPDIDSSPTWRAATRVLRDTGSGWRFRHEAYRRAAYETLTFERRRHLHSAIADHLRADHLRADHLQAQHRSSHQHSNGAVVALHLQAAGREAEAYPLTVAAARTAKATGALPEAVDLLDRAATMARRLDPRSSGELLLELGETQLWTGDPDGATATYTAAAKQLTDPVEQTRLAHLRADLALSRNQLRQASTWINKGRAVAATIDERAAPMRIHLLLHEAVLLDLRGKRTTALEPARQALEQATRAGIAPLVGLAHLQLETILSGLMRPEAVAHGDAAIEVFEAIGDDRHLDRALNNSGLTAMYLGRWDDALVRYERARAHAERCGHPVDVAFVEMNTGFLELRRRRYEAADAFARRALRTFSTARHVHGTAMVTVLSSMVASAMGRHVEADALLASARTMFEQLADTAMVVDCDVTAIDALVRRGAHDEVARRAASIEPKLHLAEPETVITFHRARGTALAAIGDPAGITMIERALARAREQHLLYEVYLCLGALATSLATAGHEAGGQSPSTAARVEHDQLARTLGVVTE